MIVAIFSDSHDNVWNLEKAMERVAEEQAEILIHCGDYCAPFVLAELAKFRGEVHGIFGNVDGDKFLMADFVHTKFSNITLHGDVGELDIEGRKVAFVHDPKLARALAATAEYDIVFYGHTHEKAEHQVGSCLIVNPGEIMGRINTPSFCLYNTEKNSVNYIMLA